MLRVVRRFMTSPPLGCRIRLTSFNSMPGTFSGAAGSASVSQLRDCPEWARLLCHSMLEYGNSVREVMDIFGCVRREAEGVIWKRQAAP